MRAQRNLAEDLALVGIAAAEIDAIAKRCAPDWEAATAEFQKLVKARRKERQREAHPDAGGDLERSQAINAAADGLLAGIRLGPPPQPRVVVFQVGFSAWTGTGSTTTNGWSW